MSFIVVEEKLYLFKTKYSPNWYAIHRESNNKNEIRRSTKTTDMNKAIAFAIRMKMEIEVKTDAGIPITIKNTFGKYSKLAIASMENDPKPKAIFDAYTSVMNRCVTPYFGKKDIKTIKHREFMLYFDQLGEMSLTQIRNRQGALKRAFIEAIKDGTVDAIPLFPKKESKKKEIRVPITHEDKELLESKYQEFIDAGITQKTKSTRTLLLQYMRFLANTGIRTGEEMRFNFNDIEIKGRKAWMVIHKGKIKDSKKAKRKVRLNDKAKECLLTVARSHFPAFKGKIKELSKIDKIVFSIDGKEPSMLLPFNQLKVFVGLVDPLKTLYSFRHTYITSAITAGLPLADIATQCGTSVEMIEQHYNHLLTDNDKFEKVSFKMIEYPPNPDGFVNLKTEIALED